MTKMCIEKEARRETLENAMASIGGIKKHLEIMAHRIANATHHDLINPSIAQGLDEEITYIYCKLNETQKYLSELHKKKEWQQ